MKKLYSICLILLSNAFSPANLSGTLTIELPHFIWNFGIIFSADKGFNQDPKEYFLHEPIFNKAAYRNIKAGDVVWIKCKFIPQFCKEILPELKEPFILLISDGDENFPSECGCDFDIETLINNDLIIHIFAQNNDYKGPSNKITSIPIGLDFHTVAYHGSAWGEQGSPQHQEQQLNAILKNLKPTHLRKKKAFVDFQHADTMHGELNRYLKTGEDRKSIFGKIVNTGLIDYGPWMKRSDLWKIKGEYAFSVSPHGNGLDCHRTWEDLVLGCIVIVKTSPLDNLYEGLPVVIINDWAEINNNNLEKWLTMYGDAFTNPHYRDQLTNAYWISKVKQLSLCIKN